MTSNRLTVFLTLFLPTEFIAVSPTPNCLQNFKACAALSFVMPQKSKF